MIIAIPTEGNKGLEDTVALHFGRCRTYALFDEEGKLIKRIDNIAEHSDGTLLPPQLLKQHGVDILLCRELGTRALKLCEEIGIDVYVHPSDKVKDLFNLWKDGKTKKASFDDVCD